MNQKTESQAALPTEATPGTPTLTIAAGRRWPAWLAALLIAGLAIAMTAPAAAQESYSTEDVPARSLEELEELVGPIALYPDDLLAIVLPASTYPLQIVEAARLLDEREAGAVVAPDEDWDDSVIALLNYPDALRLLNDDLDWTWALGEAVLAQQADVIEAVERFRDQAFLAGNLETDDHQRVSREDGVIEIETVESDVLYVPYYDPAAVVVAQPTRVYHYYPTAYPVYYYPYRSVARFHDYGFFGVSSIFSISWHSRYLHLSFHDHYAHPYHGYYYAPDYFYRHYRTRDYHRHTRVRARHDGRGHYRWHPRPHRGARPHRRHYDRERFIARSVNRGRAERRVGSDGVRDQRRRADRRIDSGGDRSRNRAIVNGQRQTAFAGDSRRRSSAAREDRRSEGSRRSGGDAATTRERQTAFTRNRAQDRPSRISPRYTRRDTGVRDAQRNRVRAQQRGDVIARAGRGADSPRRASDRPARQRVEAPSPQRRSERQRSARPSQAAAPDRAGQRRSAPARASKDDAPRSRKRDARGDSRRDAKRSSGRRSGDRSSGRRHTRER